MESICCGGLTAPQLLGGIMWSAVCKRARNSSKFSSTVSGKEGKVGGEETQHSLGRVRLRWRMP